MAETVMTIIWNVFQKDCQIVTCDVVVDCPQLPSEYSILMSFLILCYLILSHLLA